MEEKKRICLVGTLGQDPSVREAAEFFNVPIVTSDTGQECICDDFVTYFIMDKFEGPSFDLLCQLKCRILGPTALKELAVSNEPLPPSDRSRPTYCLSMKGLFICFTGFRKKNDLCHLAGLIHYMGGSIRKEMECKITHLVANCPVGDKYQYASTFNIPIMSETWVTSAWNNRNIVKFSCKDPNVIAEHKLKFGGARVCFLGFSTEETEHMTQVLLSNKGILSSMEDPQCTHLVVDCEETYDLIRTNIMKFGKPPQNTSIRLKEQPSLIKQPLFPDSLKTTLALNKQEAELKNGMSCILNFFKSEEKLEKREPWKRTLNLGFYKFRKSRILSKPEKCEKYDQKTENRRIWRRKSLILHRPQSKPLYSSPDPKKRLSIESSYFRKMEKLVLKVVDESTVSTLPDSVSPKAYVVKAEWFWASVQNELCANEKEYLFEDYIGTMFTPDKKRYQSTPMSGSASNRARKRKRLQQKTSLTQFESPLTHKRRSSISDAGLLSISGSYLDCTITPEKDIFDEVENCSGTARNVSGRYQVFLELVQTESNYVNILNTIITLFKDPLEKMTEGGDMLLNATEVRLIFGNLPPIYETHSQMLEELKWGVQNWKEEFSVGNVLLKYAPELLKAYPPFINYFEKSKETLEQCDATKPRFHAFLKIRQTKPECGRQTLKELLIRPVQRLPSITLLLNDLLKQTDKQNPDQGAVEQALISVKEVMKHINEDKRKTEAQLAMFDLFNEIDNCPAHLISSHRSLVAKCECVELTDVLSSKKGDVLVFLLFSDTLEVCKKRARTFNTFSRSTKVRKQYKHIRLMPLSNLRKVIDIKESDECQNVFALLCRNNQSLKESLCSFTITDESVDKRTFLKHMCKQMAHTVCTPDPDDFYDVMDPNEISVDTASNVSLRSTHSFSEALRFASKTGVKVGRALSMSKTPNKFTRAVSMIRPFSAQGTLTPNANQLAQMRLQSCANLNELNCTPTPRDTPVPPMSAQPTRRNMMASAFSVSSLKLL